MGIFVEPILYGNSAVVFYSTGISIALKSNQLTFLVFIYKNCWLKTNDLFSFSRIEIRQIESAGDGVREAVGFPRLVRNLDRKKRIWPTTTVKSIHQQVKEKKKHLTNLFLTLSSSGSTKILIVWNANAGVALKLPSPHLTHVIKYRKDQKWRKNFPSSDRFYLVR